MRVSGLKGSFEEKMAKIRLYVDEIFRVGSHVKLPESELRYCRDVRRGQGEIELFNREGQIARGKIQQSFYAVEEVVQNQTPVYPMTFALALPEAAVIPSCIRSLSELGIERLFFFVGDRSQAGKKRLEISPRWEKIALESARQCGRGRPLELEAGKWQDTPYFLEAGQKFFFDEDDRSGSSIVDLRKTEAGKCFALLGCEGGWSPAEREIARESGFQTVHFRTPILKVETAAACAGLYCVLKM